jgi:tripartite-type tricarboxylate transporter receptor subunit TctC
MHTYGLMTVILGLPLAAGSAHAQQKYPTKPIRLLVAYAPGGSADAVPRMLSEKLSASWGQPVVVDNRPGAGGLLAAVALTKAAPDGHTLLFDGGNFTIGAVSQTHLPYDPVKDFAGVTRVGLNTTVMVVAPATGVKSVNELIALAKAQPGKIIFGSTTAGSGPTLNGARFSLAAGIKTVTVAFKGASEQMIEVLAGRIHYSIASAFATMPFIQDGKLLPLAVFTPQRSSLLPDVPAMGEILPEFKRDTGIGTGLLAPAATQRPILHQISKEVARVLELADIKARLQGMGIVPAPSTPEEHDKLLRENIAYLSRLVRDAGLRAK